MDSLLQFARRIPSAVVLANAAVRGGSPKGRFPKPVNAERKDVVVVKKSVIAAICVFLAAAAGALGAAFFYLRRREAELDEYEQLLFSEDFDEDEPAESNEETDAGEEEAAPAEE